MAQDINTEKKPRRNWLKIALLTSLVVNLLFVGLVVGAVAGKHRDDGRKDRSDVRVLRELGPYGRALPDTRRDALVSAMRPSREDRQDMGRQLRGGFQEILRLLREDPFDDLAYADQLANQQALIDNRILVGQSALLEQIRLMSPEERRAYADKLERDLRRGPREEPKR